MKILHTRFKKGIVKVVPKSLEDLWHLYNVIYPGDHVYAKTTREVKVEQEYARPKQGKRVSVLLGVKVEKVYWDRTLNRLRVHGVVTETPEKISARGSHHTLNIRVDKPLTIVKPKWQKHLIQRLKKASRPETPPIVVLSIDDEEYCVAVLRQYGIDVKAEERTRLPGKLEADKRAEALRGFFKSALQSLRITWTTLRKPAVAIIGPGFVKKGFVRYVQDRDSDIAQNIVDVKSVNSAGVSGVQEALRSGVLTKTLRHVRIAEETKLVEELLARIGKETQNATYGFDEVAKAAQYGAVERLLVADVALRETTDEKRSVLEEIMRKVETKGGQVTILSAEHEAGAKLQGLGSIAALLRFPIGGF
ncbi:MAG: mRNA surveillance protein pelota [Candidatus Bathyarchaeota archaeon]